MQEKTNQPVEQPEHLASEDRDHVSGVGDLSGAGENAVSAAESDPAAPQSKLKRILAALESFLDSLDQNEEEPRLLVHNGSFVFDDIESIIFSGGLVKSK